MGQVVSALGNAITGGSALEALAMDTLRFGNMISGGAESVSGGSHELDQLRREQDQALAQLQARQGLEETHQAQQTALDRAELQAQNAETERERQAALRRAMAAQRASFGASGIGASGSGSAQAVLLGLFEDSEEDRTAAERYTALKTQALDQSQAQARAMNVLQRTQLKERQNLDYQLARENARGGLFF